MRLLILKIDLDKLAGGPRSLKSEEDALVLLGGPSRGDYISPSQSTYSVPIGRYLLLPDSY